MKRQYINQLIERFLNAETTLHEEQQLYEFFAQDDIPAELEPYRDMFRDLACLNESNGHNDLSILDEEKDTASHPNVIELRPKILHWRHFGVAASIAALMISGLFIYNRIDNNYAVAYINDKKITDDAIAVQIGTDAVSDIFNSNDDPADDLYDIFNPEQ